MTPVLIEGPALEPILLDEAKTWLRIDQPDDDALLGGLILAARVAVEAEIGRVLIGQTWRLIGDAWPPDGAIAIPFGQVLAVPGGRVFRREGPPVALPPEAFRLRPCADPPVLDAVLMPLPGRPRGGIEIDLRLGYGEAPADVPAPIRLALRRLVALWYEQRGDAGPDPAGLPPQIRLLLRPFRRLRLGGSP